MDLVTLLSTCVLGNLHLAQIISGIRLSQGKEIHLSPKVKGHALGIFVLYDTFVIVLHFALLLKSFFFFFG